MSEKFSVFMPVLPKDYNKLKFGLAALLEHVPGVQDVVLCTPDPTQLDPKTLQLPKQKKIQIVADREVLNIDPRLFRHRPNWMMQMFVKLFQKVTQYPLYLTLDADVVINRKLPMFDEDKRILYLGPEQNHRPYFEFQERMLGLPRLYPHTFITDMNFFDQRIIQEMLRRNGYTQQSFIDKSQKIIDNTCYLGEPELYGQYVYKYHMKNHVFKQLKSTGVGRKQRHPTEQIYQDNEILNTMRSLKAQDYDTFVLHSWYTTNEYLGMAPDA